MNKTILHAVAALLPTAAALVGALAMPAWGDEAPEIEIHNAWVRALPPTQSNTAAYLDIVNRGQSAVTVVGATASVAGSVEIHTTREVDGYMRMEQLPELRLAAGESYTLAPAGTHLMLLALQHMPAEGESVTLCLQFAAGDELCAEAVARRSASSDNAHHHHH